MHWCNGLSACGCASGSVYLGEHILLTEEEVSQFVQDLVHPRSVDPGHGDAQDLREIVEDWGVPDSVDHGQRDQTGVLQVIEDLRRRFGITVGVGHCTELKVFDLRVDDHGGRWYYVPKGHAVPAAARTDSHHTIPSVQYQSALFLLKVIQEQLKAQFRLPPGRRSVGYDDPTKFAKKNIGGPKGPKGFVSWIKGVDFDRHQVVDAAALAESLLKYMEYKDAQVASCRQFLFQWDGLRLHRVDAKFVVCAVAKIAFETLPFLPFI